MFDRLFYHTIQSYKAASKKRNQRQLISIATWYISIVQLALLFVLYIILMKATSESFLKFYTIYKPIIYIVLSAFVLYLFNAIYFSGKRLLVIKSKATQAKKEVTSIWKLWMLPLGIASLGFILLQAA